MFTVALYWAQASTNSGCKNTGQLLHQFIAENLLITRRKYQ